jgi:hypothetical protein
MAYDTSSSMHYASQVRLLCSWLRRCITQYTNHGSTSHDMHPCPRVALLSDKINHQPNAQDMYAASPGQHFSTPQRHSSAAAFEQAAVSRMDALSAFSVPASALESAGKQDEVSPQASIEWHGSADGLVR